MTPVDNTFPQTRRKTSHPFWKWFWLTFLVLSLAYAWYSFYAPSNNAKWENEMTTIPELTNTSDKNTILFFTGQWCSHCQIMKREVFSDMEVEAMINSQFRIVMIDMAKANSHDIVKHYQVSVTPTTIVIDAQGKVIAYQVGKIEKNKFLEMLSGVDVK